MRKNTVELERLERSDKFWLDEHGGEWEAVALFDLASPSDLGVTAFTVANGEIVPLRPRGSFDKSTSVVLGHMGGGRVG